jgi:hypothetical protein
MRVPPRVQSRVAAARHARTIQMHVQAARTQRTDVDAPPFDAMAWRKNPLEDEVQYAVLAVLRKCVVPGVLQETVLASHRQRLPPLDPCHYVSVLSRRMQLSGDHGESAARGTCPHALNMPQARKREHSILSVLLQCFVQSLRSTLINGRWTDRMANLAAWHLELRPSALHGSAQAERPTHAVALHGCMIMIPTVDPHAC